MTCQRPSQALAQHMLQGRCVHTLTIVCPQQRDIRARNDGPGRQFTRGDNALFLELPIAIIIVVKRQRSRTPEGAHPVSHSLYVIGELIRIESRLIVKPPVFTIKSEVFFQYASTSPERKQIDRAKGLLMQSKGLTEQLHYGVEPFPERKVAAL